MATKKKSAVAAALKRTAEARFSMHDLLETQKHGEDTLVQYQDVAGVYVILRRPWGMDSFDGGLECVSTVLARSVGRTSTFSIGPSGGQIVLNWAMENADRESLNDRFAAFSSDQQQEVMRCLSDNQVPLALYVGESLNLAERLRTHVRGDKDIGLALRSSGYQWSELEIQVLPMLGLSGSTKEKKEVLKFAEMMLCAFLVPLFNERVN